METVAAGSAGVEVKQVVNGVVDDLENVGVPRDEDFRAQRLDPRYGVEVKFYNMEVALDRNLETPHKGLFVIGDGSGVTHSLSHASASGVYVARYIAENA